MAAVVRRLAALGDLHGVQADLGQFLVPGQPAADADAAHNDAVGGADYDAADAGGEVGVAVVADGAAAFFELLAGGRTAAARPPPRPPT